MICQEPEQGMTWELPPAVIFMGSLVSRRSVIKDSLFFQPSGLKEKRFGTDVVGAKPPTPPLCERVARLAHVWDGKEWHCCTWNRART